MHVYNICTLSKLYIQMLCTFEIKSFLNSESELGYCSCLETGAWEGGIDCQVTAALTLVVEHSCFASGFLLCGFLG